MIYKNSLKTCLIALLTCAPILIFIFTAKIIAEDFDLLSGRLMYISFNHYFSMPSVFVSDLAYFLPPIIWALAVYFCLKIRKIIENRNSFLNYSVLILTTLNIILILYSIWFLYLYFT